MAKWKSITGKTAPKDYASAICEKFYTLDHATRAQVLGLLEFKPAKHRDNKDKKAHTLLDDTPSGKMTGKAILYSGKEVLEKIGKQGQPGNGDSCIQCHLLKMEHRGRHILACPHHMPHH